MIGQRVNLKGGCTGNAYQKARVKTFIGNTEEQKDQYISVCKTIKRVPCLPLALLLIQLQN